VSDGGLDVVAIVPARGGSRSLPRKNLRGLAGHPLLAWSIAAGRLARCVDMVLVSTDDEEIREIALAYGAEAPFLRPRSLAQDDTPDRPVFEHALAWLEREGGRRPELVVQLRPTSPLRPPGLVDGGVQLLRGSPGAHSVRSVTPPGQNPYKMWRIEGRYLRPLLGDVSAELYNQPRQKLPTTFWQTGHLDLFRSDTLLRHGSMTGSQILPLVVDPGYAVDIDTEEQLELAAWLLARGELDCVRPEPAARPSPAVPSE
jgi:CMP-N-acetylneuraminic acid synthetase